MLEHPTWAAKVPDPSDQLRDALSDRYRLERELGRGGMATVYLAQDLKHERLVALKVLHPELAYALGPERFLREIRLTARLDHPHILPVLDSGTDASLLWYTMPYVRGESLRECLRRETQLSLEMALEVAREIASALDYASREGVIHRDLKPENILLSEGQARVADFGVAKALGADGEHLTETGMAVGTPAYMSPEQASGDRVDARSDIYALGCVLYEMLAGEPPFTGRTAQAIVAKRMIDPVPSVRRLRPEVPEGVDAVLGRALAKIPADRFTSPAEFARALAERATPPASAATARTRRLTQIVTLGALGTVLATTVVLWSADLLGRHGTDPKRVMVAMLGNRSGNPALEPVGLTAADYITRGLVQTGLVEVVDVGVLYVQGRGASGGPAEPLALARRNGAGLVVAGSYDQSGDNLVFQASIVDPSTGRVLRALEPVQGPLARRELALEALRQRVTVGLAGLVDPRLSQLTTPTTEPPTYAAYQAFVAGQSAYWSGNTEEGIAQFRRAGALDSTFLTAAVWVALSGGDDYSGCHMTDSVGRALVSHRDQLTLMDRLLLDAQLADCRGDYATAARILSQPAPVLSRSSQFQMFRALFTRLAGRPREAVEILRRIDPEHDLGWLPDSGKMLYRRDLAVPYHTLGDYRNELRVARALVREAPNQLSSINLETRALAGLGKTSDVLERVERALKLAPDPLMIYPLAKLTVGRRMLVDTPGRLCYEAALELQAHGHPEAARRAAERGVTWHRTQPTEEQRQPEYRYTLARLLELLGRYDEATSLLQGLAAEDSSNVDYSGALGMLAARRGDRTGAERIDQRLALLSRPYYFGYPVYYRAQIAALLGERDRAVRLLRDAVARGAVDAWDHLHSEPAFAALHGYPPFDEVLRPKG
jgi:tetratricopeptide (TPR) repeat protein/tRNA A-37 threonylcarbamoyl transferase component Bud32